MTLSAYIRRRLGPSDRASVLLKENFRRSFTAPSQRGRPPVPETATWFVLVATAILLSERVRIRFDDVSKVGRVAIHMTVLAGTHALASLLAR